MKIIIPAVIVGILLGIFFTTYLSQQLPVEDAIKKQDFTNTKTQIKHNLERIESSINKYINAHGSMPEKTGDVDFSTVLTAPGNLVTDIKIDDESKGIIYITFAETETGGASGKQLVLETDGSLYRKDPQGRDMKIIPKVKVTSEGIIYIQPPKGKSAVPVVKNELPWSPPCRCDYDVVDERPLCSDYREPGISLAGWCKSEPQKEKPQAQLPLPYAIFSCYSVNMPMNYLPDNCHVDIFWHELLAKRQAEIDEQQRLAEEEAAAEAKRREEENKPLEDEKKARYLWSRRLAEREFAFFMPDDAPKILSKTNSFRWSSATLLSLPYSEGPIINEDIRKEIFEALTLIQEKHKEVEDVHASERFPMSYLLIELTPLGKETAKPVRVAGGHREFNPLDTGIPELDELNGKYDVISLQGNSYFLYVEFRKALNLNYVVEDYKRVDKLKYVYTNDIVAGGGGGIVLKEKGDLWEFVFSRGWGDCPSGCIHHRYYVFSYNRKDKIVKKESESGSALPRT